MARDRNENWLVRAEEEVCEAHQAKRFRPTVVALLKNKSGEILLVRSAKDSRTWYFPQGGIDVSETLLTAFSRELHEEVGINSSQLMICSYRGSASIPAESDRKDKRGFSEGKKYFTIAALYTGDSNELVLDTDEVDDFLWATRERVPNIMAYTRKSKRNFMLKLLGIDHSC